MIDTYIFSVGDQTEVKEWLDTNATDIFDEIVNSGTSILCKKDNLTVLSIGFDSNQTCVAKLSSSVSFTARGYNQNHFTKAYRTTNGIYLFAKGSSYNVAVSATKNGDVYANNGFDSIRSVGKIGAPSFTSISAPTSFVITALSPAPYSSASVSEDMLIPIWTQLTQQARTYETYIVQINNINYVYDGFIALRE
ncbi:MAG: hypothetical protein J6T10_20995 [Methanobrevibacter sp.]|nr:hypothetical protein [Methanobrevibacter sp.]